MPSENPLSGPTIKKPPERTFVALLREICTERGIELLAYHGDWVLTLRKGARVEHVFGYDFSLNSASAQQIAKDKAATYSILAEAKIPAIEHQLLMSPLLPDYVPSAGNWDAVQRFFERCDRDIVCKPNDGTGGRDVFRVRDPVQLERAVHTLLSKARACALSPYVEAKEEYRVMLLDGEAQLIYRKKRPMVMGDGKRMLVELLGDWLKQNVISPDVALKALGKLELPGPALKRVLASGEIHCVNWRHNLGQGAMPEELADALERRQLIELARAAMGALRIRVASVDIMLLANGALQVLEINSGIMMEQFAQASRARAIEVYRRIVDHLFPPD